jgi:hypothetical protein
VVRHIGDDEGIGVAEGEVEGLDLAADAFGRLLGRGPSLAAATLKKAFGTLRGVGERPRRDTWACPPPLRRDGWGRGSG